MNFNYFCIHKNTNNLSSSCNNNHIDTNTQYSFKPFKKNPLLNLTHVKLSSNNFHDCHLDWLEFKDKWFVNLSNSNIPIDVQRLLQLGEGFSLPATNAQTTTINFIKYVENSISKIKITL